MKIKNIIRTLAIVVIAAIAGVVFLTIVPEFGGYKALVVTTGSMSPAVKVGGIVFVRHAVSYAVGDIITFRQGLDPRSLTTHRIVSMNEVNGRKMFETKGDAVERADIELIAEHRIVGKVLFSLPFVGRPIVFAKTQLGVTVLVIIPAAIIVYEELKKIKGELIKSPPHLSIRFLQFYSNMAYAVIAGGFGRACKFFRGKIRVRPKKK